MKLHRTVAIAFMVLTAAVLGGLWLWRSDRVHGVQVNRESPAALNIAVVGTPPPGSMQNVSLRPIRLPQVSDQFQALWISESDARAITRPEEVDILRRALERGTVVLFLGAQAPNHVLTALGGGNAGEHDPSQSTDRRVGSYLWQERRGKIKAGEVFVPKDAPDRLIFEALVDVTRNHLRQGQN